MYPSSLRANIVASLHCDQRHSQTRPTHGPIQILRISAFQVAAPSFRCGKGSSGTAQPRNSQKGFVMDEYSITSATLARYSAILLVLGPPSALPRDAIASLFGADTFREVWGV